MTERFHRRTSPHDLARFAVALLIAGIATCLSATESITEPPQEGRPRLELDVVLDPQLSREQRAGGMTKLIAAADGGDGYAQYVLGALYRLGDQHPAALVAADPEKAALYLSNAAIRGWTVAMAGMAELRLSQGKALDAAIWTQLHIRYREIEAAVSEATLSSNRAYEADLLRRCQLHLKEGEEISGRIAADVAAFIERHDARIRREIGDRTRDGDGNATAAPQLPAGMREWDFGSAPQRLSEPGQVVYLIAINGQGRVEHRFTVDSLPDQRFARALRRHVGQLRFKAAGHDQPLHWMLAPLEFDNRMIRLQ